MSYRENHTLKTHECDVYGRWKPSAIMDAMQETATSQCNAAGLGREFTLGLGVVWILSRSRVELDAVPAYGQSVDIETFPMPARHLFFPRAHVFRAASGQIIGSANSWWLLMDIRTRRAVMNDVVAARLPVEDRPSPASAPATVHPLNDAPISGGHAPRFDEFDLNGHVNNTRYLDWCWNALGFEALRDRELACFDVNYDREVLPGEYVETQLCAQDDAFSFRALLGGQRCFSMSGRLRESKAASLALRRTDGESEG